MPTCYCNGWTYRLRIIGIVPYAPIILDPYQECGIEMMPGMRMANRSAARKASIFSSIDRDLTVLYAWIKPNNAERNKGTRPSAGTTWWDMTPCGTSRARPGMKVSTVMIRSTRSPGGLTGSSGLVGLVLILVDMVVV